MSDPLDALIDQHLPTSSKAADPLDALIDQHLQPQPTLDAFGTGALHFVRHGLAGLGDKATAAIQTLGDLRADKTGKHTFGETYSRNLAFLDKVAEASDEAHPLARWVGNGLGVVANLGMLGAAVPSAPAATLGQAAKQGAISGAALGAAGGYGADRSDSGWGTLANTALGSALGAGAGATAPYLADYVGRGASALGEKARDLAGKLKVGSLHPVPTLGEKMAELPGGEVGVGRELLEQGLGGLTKRATADQIDAAGEQASKVAGNMARAYDAQGGAPVDLSAAIFRAANHAEELKADPLTREAGEKLEQKLMEYANKYRSGETSAADALQLKRTLGKHVFGAKVALKSGDVLGGEYGRGLAEMQRGVDDALDTSLGPEFANANLLVRRLMGAGDAATRSAGKTLHPLGLIPTILGSTAFGAHGAEGGAAATLGAMLLHAYGRQAGARLLYSPVGGGLGLLGQGLRALPGAMSGGVAAEEASPLAARLTDLLRPAPLPAVAQERLRQQALAQGGSP